MKLALPLAFVLGFATFSVLPACALSNLTLKLDNGSQSGAPGGVVNFTGTLTNNTNTILTLSGDTPVIQTGPGTIDDSPTTNVLFTTLNPFGTAGDSLDLSLFNVDINAITNPAGDTITGTFAVQAQDSSSNSYDSGSQFFSVTVTPSASAAPEPSQIGMLALMGLGLGGLLLRARRRSLTA